MAAKRAAHEDEGGVQVADDAEEMVAEHVAMMAQLVAAIEKNTKAVLKLEGTVEALGGLLDEVTAGDDDEEG